MKIFTIALFGALIFTLALSNSALTYEVMSLHLNPRAEGIIGADDRLPLEWGKTARLQTTSIGGTFSFSTKTVVRLLDWDENFVCTGAVVGPTTILTAAHCVYWDGDWLDNFDGIPHFAETWDGQLFNINFWEKSSDYIGTPLPQNPRSTTDDQFAIDYALVHTSKPISGVTGGFLGISRATYFGKTSVFMHLVAFHGDVETRRPKLLVSELCLGKVMSSTLWLVVIVDRELGHVIHECDSSGGSSGAPMLTEQGQVFGVHVASPGSDGKGAFGVHLGAKNNGNIPNWLYKEVRKDRENYGFRVKTWGSGSNEKVRYLESEFQGPDDVEWLKPVDVE